MAKYDLEYKLQIVRGVLEEGKGIKVVAKEYGVCKGDAQKWVAAYQIHGMDGLARKKNSYTGEFKQQVVEDMRANRMSLRQTAAKYNLEHYAISKWERIYLEEGPEGLYIDRRGQTNSKGKPPKLSKAVEEDLIAEVQRLRAEVDYLKKLNALVLEEERRDKRRK